MCPFLLIYFVKHHGIKKEKKPKTNIAVAFAGLILFIKLIKLNNSEIKNKNLVTRHAAC